MPYVHNINPVAIAVGPMTLHWYGLMYMAGFTIAWALAKYRAGRPGSGWTTRQVDDLITYCIAGLIIGARLGYVAFYEPAHFLTHPWDILALWKGGMSFHGGAVGVTVALWRFAKKNGKRFFAVTDFLLPLAPPGLFCGRIGNFINGELWGKPTDLPWAIIFPRGGLVPRHPSMLYEAALEGIVLFFVVWIFSSRKPPVMATSGLFLLGYGLFRSLVEFVRMPDPQLGYLAFGWVTMGQILSLPMILGGAALLALACARK